MQRYHSQELEYIKSLGFIVNPDNKQVNTVQEAWNYMQTLGTKRDSLKYHIDGVVVKLNSNIDVQKLGIVGKTPRGWCALKYPAEEKTSKLIGVTWQVGRTGKLTPVAEIEPIELDGTIVKRATLHNFKQMVEYNLDLGDMLVIRKAGDIIPEVVKVIKLQ